MSKYIEDKFLSVEKWFKTLTAPQLEEALQRTKQMEKDMTDYRDGLYGQCRNCGKWVARASVTNFVWEQQEIRDELGIGTLPVYGFHCPLCGEFVDMPYLWE